MQCPDVVVADVDRSPFLGKQTIGVSSVSITCVHCKSMFSIQLEYICASS